MKRGRGLVYLSFAIAALLGARCGSDESSASGCGTVIGGDGDGGTGPGGTEIVYGFPGCTGLQCQVATCPTGLPATTLTGVVNIPANNLPLYNATVYIPNSPLTTIADGPSCDRCGDRFSGQPLTYATTNYKGEFSLANVPVGDNIPLVIQLGKWRREVTIPKVEPCANATLANAVTRLPKDKSEGHLPRIALTTGGADPLECLLRKIGIADSEFTTETGSGRVNFFSGEGGTTKFSSTVGGGATFTRTTAWWGNVANLNKYDVIMHACEGTTDSTTNTNGTKPMGARQALKAYADAGGRVFLSHWHHYWVEFGPAPFPSVMQFQQGTDINHLADLTSAQMPMITADINTGFERGSAMADWLLYTGGSTQRGKLVLKDAQNTIKSITPTAGQAWISYPSANNVQYTSFNTPVGTPADMQCGRVVTSDIHVSNGDAVNKDFPTGCTTTTLSPQEKALIFMFFDLAACIESQVG